MNRELSGLVASVGELCFTANGPKNPSVLLSTRGLMQIIVFIILLYNNFILILMATFLEPTIRAALFGYPLTVCMH